jgi:4-nitrophenyl phosphatase
MIKGVILDLDGTVYRGQAEVPGAGRFARDMAGSGVRCLFVTNRANRRPEEIARQLAGYGIPCGPSDVLTSAEATAQYLGGGSAYYIGQDGLRAALEAAGIRIDDCSPDAVVVSLDLGLTPEKVETAARLIRAGARFVATNPDRWFPTETGNQPGTGTIVDAVAAKCGRKPIVVGKPERLIMDMALRRLRLAAAEAIAVGDNVETDIPAGAAAGMRTVLLLTGVSSREDLVRAPVPPTWVVEGYEELTRIVEADGAQDSP